MGLGLLSFDVYFPIIQLIIAGRWTYATQEEWALIMISNKHDGKEVSIYIVYTYLFLSKQFTDHFKSHSISSELSVIIIKIILILDTNFDNILGTLNMSWQMSVILEVTYRPSGLALVVPAPGERKQCWTGSETWAHWSAPVWPEPPPSPLHPLPAPPHPTAVAAQCKACWTAETCREETQWKRGWLTWLYKRGVCL